MPLTAEGLIRVRLLSGGIVGPNEPDYLTDAQIQAEYTAAAEVFDLALVYVLRLRCGATAQLDDTSVLDGMSSKRSQRHEQICELLGKWEERLGLAGGPMQGGVIDLGLDTDCEDWR